MAAAAVVPLWRWAGGVRAISRPVGRHAGRMFDEVSALRYPPPAVTESMECIAETVCLQGNRRRQRPSARSLAWHGVKLLLWESRTYFPETVAHESFSVQSSAMRKRDNRGHVSQCPASTFL
jgi:hypothetical protein